MTAWYALKVRAKAELLVERSLKDRCQETFVPTYVESRQYCDRVRRVTAALFPGYLFCRFDSDHRLPILQGGWVQHIVGDSRGPIPVEEGEIDALQRVVSGALAVQPWPFLCTGDRVRIRFGAFAGVEGILVSEKKGADLLILSVQLLQRSIAVHVDRSWITPIVTRPITTWAGHQSKDVLTRQPARSNAAVASTI